MERRMMGQFLTLVLLLAAGTHVARAGTAYDDELAVSLFVGLTCMMEMPWKTMNVLVSGFDSGILARNTENTFREPFVSDQLGMDQNGTKHMLWQAFKYADSSIYFVYIGFKNGRILGYYRYSDVDSSPVFTYSENENSSCPALGVDDHCRHTYENVDEVTGEQRQSSHTANRYDPRWRPWYINSVAGNVSVWSDVYVFADIWLPGITATSQVFNMEKEFLGVAAVDYLLSQIETTLFASAGIDNNETVAYIVDQYGLMVAASISNVSVTPAGAQVRATECTEPAIAGTALYLNNSAEGFDTSGVASVFINGTGWMWVESMPFEDDFGLNWYVVVAEYVNCEAGYSMGDEECETCAAGTFAPAASINCTACPAGRASSDAAESCTSCEAGKYAASSGSTTCSKCDAGSYSNESATACTDCEAGTYQSATGQQYCTSCEAGKHAASTGSTSCSSCSAGTFSNTSASVCTACDAGRFSPSGSSSCTACPAGYYRAAGSSSGCTVCEAGYVSASTASSDCTACGVGSYQSATGQSSCDDCETGKYSDVAGSSSCTACEYGYGSEYTSTAASSSCDSCLSDYYMNHLSNECEECPSAGVDCDHAGSTLTNLQVLAGYYRFTANSTSVYACTYSGNCLRSNETTDEGRCRVGSGGPLCSVCQATLDGGYYLDRDTLVCEPCASVTSSASMIMFCLLVVLVICLATALYVRASRKREQRMTLAKTRGADVSTHDLEIAWTFEQMREEDELEDKTHAGEADVLKHGPMGIALSVSKVFITTTQTAVILLANHDSAGGTRAPSTMSKYFEFWGVLDLQLGDWMPGFACTLDGFEYDLFGMTGAFAIVLLLSVLRYWHRRSIGDPHAWHTLKRLVIIAHLSLPAVSTTIFTTLRCQSYDGGDFRFLVADHSIDCDSVFYKSIQLYAILMIALFPVGLPLLAFVQLRRLQPHFDSVERRHFAHHPVLGKHPLFPLYSQLEPPFAVWHSVLDMGRRLLLTCGTLVVTRLSAFTTMAISVSCLALAVHEHFEPFENDLDDQLATVQHWQTLLLTILFVINDADMFESPLAFEFAGLFLMLVNLVLILLIFWQVLPDYDHVKSVCKWKNIKASRKWAYDRAFGTFLLLREEFDKKADELQPKADPKHSDNAGKAVELVSPPPSKGDRKNPHATLAAVEDPSPLRPPSSARLLPPAASSETLPVAPPATPSTVPPAHAHAHPPPPPARQALPSAQTGSARATRTPRPLGRPDPRPLSTHHPPRHDLPSP